MRLFSFIKGQQMARIGIELDGKKYDFTRIWDYFKDIRGQHRLPEMYFLQVLLEMGMFNKKTIKEIITTVTNFRSLDDIKLSEPIRYDVPIARPQKIICLGRNYIKHAEEFQKQVPPEPIIFSKIPSSLLPHLGTILLPRAVGRVDHEIELALVIGKSGKYISAKNAFDHIAGYTVLNDVTARALQIEDIEEKKPWMRSKSFDTFCPMGPFLTPAEEIEDPHKLRISLKVNDEIKQDASTSEIVYKLPEIIQFISRHMTLQVGDVIATGTPAGVSELKPGDLVTGEIEKLGVLQNQVAADY